MTMNKEPKPIPVSAAQRISVLYGYDQVVIIARKTGEQGLEHVTTYGAGEEHKKVAAAIGDFIKYEVMRWEKDKETTHEDFRRDHEERQ